MNQEWVYLKAHLLKTSSYNDSFTIGARRPQFQFKLFRNVSLPKKKQSRFDFPTETSSQSVEYRPKLKFSEVHIWCLGCLKNFIVQNLAKYQNFVKKWESPLEPKNHVYPFRLYCNSLKKSTFWVVLVLSANKKFQLEYQRIWGGVSIYFKVFSSVQKCLWGFGQLTKFQLQICAERSKSYLRWIYLINFRFNDHDDPMLLIFLNKNHWILIISSLKFRNWRLLLIIWTLP